MEVKITWVELTNDAQPPQYSTILTYGDPFLNGYGICICTFSDGIFRDKESDREHKGHISHWAELPDTPEGVY